MAEVKTTIGAGNTHDFDITIESVSGSDPYTVTCDDTTGAVVGDALFDTADGGPPQKSLIQSVDSGTQLTVTASNPSTAGSAQAEIKRYYDGSSPLTDWNAGLSAGIYSASSDAVGEVWNDAIIDDKFSLNGGSSLNSVTLTVAASERHDGTDASGARIVSTSTGPVIDITQAGFAYVIEWLEISQNFSPTSAQNYGIRTGQDDDPVIQNCLIYGIVGSTHNARQAIGIGIGGSRALPEITNCMVFNNGGGTSDASGGIGIYLFSASAAVGVLNCTVHNNVDVGVYGGVGIKAAGSNLVARNCICTDNANGDFDGTFGTEDYNLSSDDTAVGTDLDNQVSGDLFEDNSAPNLHLKTGSNAQGEGTDLGTAANIDIDGNDRQVTTYDPWDIGAHELQESPAAAGGTKGTLALTGVGV